MWAQAEGQDRPSWDPVLELSQERQQSLTLSPTPGGKRRLWPSGSNGTKSVLCQLGPPTKSPPSSCPVPGTAGRPEIPGLAAEVALAFPTV